MPDVESQVRQWLERVVIGLNLCPFAGVPYRNGLVRFAVSRAATDEALLSDLRSELQRLDETLAESLETTLLVVADMLGDFEAYNQFLDEVDILLKRGRWVGVYQVASFHPQYRFEGTESDDPGNLTNRSPWPILHILREASIDQALADHPHPEAIPERNMQLMQKLNEEERREFFPR